MPHARPTRFSRRRLLTLAMLVASGCFAAFTLAACGPSDPRPAVKVVASVGVLADAAFKIGYPCAQVVAIVGAAVDPHRFDPSPDQLDQVRDADLVLAVGLGLERRALPVLTRAREGKAAGGGAFSAAVSRGETSGMNPFSCGRTDQSASHTGVWFRFPRGVCVCPMGW